MLIRSLLVNRTNNLRHLSTIGAGKLFSAKGQIVNILSLQATQRCCRNVKAAIDSTQTNECGHDPMNLYLQKLTVKPVD